MSVDIKKIRPSNRYINGLYKCKNSNKYIGDSNAIIYRSSYELKFCQFCDTSDSVIKWSSEPFSIPYFNEFDNKKHSYFIDFYAKIFNELQGKPIDYLIEIKPSAKLKKPKRPKKATPKKLKTFNESAIEYIRNMSKFSAAKLYASSIGYEFKIITELQLFI